MNQISRTSISTVVIMVAALFGVFLFLIEGCEIKKKLEEDVFRLTYQFLLIGVVGSGVTLVLKNFSLERDLARERRAALREMHSDLLASFNLSKKIRRTLRAKAGYDSKRGIDAKIKIPASLYEEKIGELMEAQLNFEVYTKRAKDSRLWFKRGEALAEALGEVEDYLNGIIKEYENELDHFDGDPPERVLAELPVLSEFLTPYKKAPEFKSRFARPFKAALLELSNAGLE
ncbi:MAG: hypothetical protein AAGM22_30465 [Acidobacteriota bacterium]